VHHCHPGMPSIFSVTMALEGGPGGGGAGAGAGAEEDEEGGGGGGGRGATVAARVFLGDPPQPANKRT